MAASKVQVDGCGITATATFTPTAAAYGAGDLVDVAKEFSWTFNNGVAIPTGSLIRILSAAIKIDITSVPSGQTSYTLRKYSRTPPSAQADNAAWTLASADLTYYRGPLLLGTPVDEGACNYIRTPYLDSDIKLEDGVTSTWGQLITEGAHTAAAVARTVHLYGVVL